MHSSALRSSIIRQEAGPSYRTFSLREPENYRTLGVELLSDETGNRYVCAGIADNIMDENLGSRIWHDEQYRA